jgi:hypothetical protein
MSARFGLERFVLRYWLMRSIRSIILIVILLLGSLLLQRDTLPPAAASSAGFVAGRCAAGRFADEQALLAALQTSHPRCTEDIARAYRNAGYQPGRFAELSGTASLSVFEQNWHRAIRSWCEQRER